MIPAAEALNRLRDGNRRFAENRMVGPATSHPERRAEIADRQEPFAIILGCSDSRVPSELVFDQGFGDLFVIRVAGNIVAPSQVGSVEFAAALYRTRLVVVMGHSRCGAVTAAVEEVLGRAPEAESRSLRSIVERLVPSVRPLLSGSREHDLARQDELIDRAVRANVRASVDHLRHGSSILEEMVRRDGLQIVGAEYSLDSGVVTFLDE